MISFDVNYWAILAAGVSSMILGSLWYSLLFVKPWMKAMGFTHADMEHAKNQGMAASYIAMFVAELVKAFIITQVVGYNGAVEWYEGLQLGLLLWLGFIGTTSLSGYIWTVKPKPKYLYIIDNGYMALTLVAQTIILTQWY